MSRICRINLSQFFYQKEDERNLISATFHMFTITLVSMSMVDLTWFSIWISGDGQICIPYLTLGQFFWFGYSDTRLNTPDSDCINSTIVNMMRITLLLCFMAIIFATAGFFLDIMGPKSLIFKMIRRYAIAGTCTMLWIMVIVTISYYIIVLLQNTIEKRYPNSDFVVSYGLGFYLIAFAGGIEALNLMYMLIVPYKSTSRHQEDDRCLIDNRLEETGNFDRPTPPPPYYSLPPPPYTP